MLCQSCNERTATIHLTEINDGLRVESHLCETCAQKEGLAVKSQIPLNELLSSLLASQADGKVNPAAGEDDPDIQCPSCGMTIQQFAKKSLLGCPEDYDVFDEQIRAIISKAQNGNTDHSGKVPSSAPADTKDQIKLSNLRQKLDEAVRNEDYETAAKIRDMIEKIK
jgi:protein arginine kinase activator